MNKNFETEVITSKGEKFFVNYRSNMVNENDTVANLIEKVQYNGYELMLHKLSECLVWKELIEAVNHASLDMWEQEWKRYNEQKENVVSQRNGCGALAD